MDVSVIAAAINTRAGTTQLAIANSMLKMNSDNAPSVVKLVDAVQQSMNSLANAVAHLGTDLNISC
jgi:hypothetical protein